MACKYIQINLFILSQLFKNLFSYLNNGKFPNLRA